MQDNLLIAIALVITALGLTGLMITLLLFEVPESSINQAKLADDLAIVRVKGEITKIRQLGDRTIITLQQPSTIDVIIDGTTSDTTTETATTTPQKTTKDTNNANSAKSSAQQLKTGQCVTVQGKKSTYNDAPQISVTKLQVEKKNTCG